MPDLSGKSPLGSDNLGNESGLKGLPHKILEEASRAGIDVREDRRAGSLLHVNRTTIYSKVNELFKDKLELLDTKVALKQYPWLEEYMWKAVGKEKDEYTKKVAEDFSGGYFIRILPGAEVSFPLQSCLMITEAGLEQRIHNLIIAEEGSRAHLISSCVQHSEVDKASHIGISEFYIKRGAILNFTMIHNWGENTLVRPRSAALIGHGGTFVSNYICVRPVKDVQMFPVGFCEGDASKVIFNSILYGRRGSLLDIGSKAVLNGKGSSSEMITRAISQDGARIIARGIVEGNNECKGHLECRGLIMDDRSFIQSIPELVARKKGSEITHEAAVGKISEKEIVYLMTRKLSREQAISTIIRGFMDVSILDLPKHLKEEVDRIIEVVAGAS